MWSWSKRGCGLASAVVGVSLVNVVGLCNNSNNNHRFNNCQSNTEKKNIYDVAVIGGGVVGLAVARACSVRGKKVILLEKEDAFAAGASSGNSGLGCTGYDAPIGSLERTLLRRSIRLHQQLYRSFGLSHEHVRKNSGSLVVAWNQEQLDKLESVLEENREAGDEDAQLLSREELLELEPALSKRALGAVFCPYEAVVEPWLVPIGYAESARIHGARLETNCKVVGAKFCEENGVWDIVVSQTAEASIGRSVGGNLLCNIPLSDVNHHNDNNSPNETDLEDEKFIVNSKIFINCAGLYGDIVDDLTSISEGQRPFSITPRKGQFVVFKPNKSATNDDDDDDEEEEEKDNDGKCKLPNCIIEPVATQFTKGVIAWKTVYGNVIVGPTAVDQSSRTDRSTDIETIKGLIKYGKSILPCLEDAEIIGTYSGLRPATEHRDYQISSNEQRRVITVGGIRSTGLTASSGIGEYVADLVDVQFGAEPRSCWVNSILEKPSDLPGVSSCAQSPIKVPPDVKVNGKVPPLSELAKNFKSRGDGTVEIYGKPHRVTHPISSFGMETM